MNIYLKPENYLQNWLGWAGLNEVNKEWNKIAYCYNTLLIIFDLIFCRFNNIFHTFQNLNPKEQV